MFIESLIRFGRNTFQEAMKLTNRKIAAQIDWTKFKYVVFDAPNQTIPYSERHALLGT